MRRKLGRFGFLFLALSVVLMQGCAQLEELRIANRRQAITIRDQMSELDKLRTELDSAKSVNRKYQDRMQSDGEVKKSVHVSLVNLAKSIGGVSSVRDTTEGAVVQLPEELLFDTGLAKLKPDGESALEKIVDYLNTNPTALVRVDGHTDNDPVDKSIYLWETNHHLSVGRALSIFQYLVTKGKIEEKRVVIAGYGPNRPIASNADEIGKKQNRRVEFLILSSDKDSNSKN
ncbi:MAG: OmpA family protein [Candidatus Brocadiaceae bacterium]|nr:OmpA family protein [Candidatus Brocadiaceae bacterium]